MFKVTTGFSRLLRHNNAVKELQNLSLCNWHGLREKWFVSGRCLLSTNTSKYSQESRSSKAYAVSHPRQHRIHEAFRRVDGLSEDWELVFSSASNKSYLQSAHWATFAVFCAAPPSCYLVYYDVVGDVPVKLLGFSIASEYLAMVAGFLMYTVQLLVFTTVYKIPKRIYYHEEQDKYFAVLPSVLPWMTYVKEFDRKEVQKTKSTFTLWGHAEYIIEGRKVLLLPYYFRSGYDYSLMIRDERPESE